MNCMDCMSGAHHRKILREMAHLPIDHPLIVRHSQLSASYIKRAGHLWEDCPGNPANPRSEP